MSEINKKFHYAGKLSVGERGQGNVGHTLRSIDWAFSSKQGVGNPLPLDVLVSTGTAGTYIYQREGKGTGPGGKSSKDLDKNWKILYQNQDLQGNICRFAPGIPSFERSCPGHLAVATQASADVGAEVHMLTLRDSASRHARLEDGTLVGSSLFDTEVIYHANFLNPESKKNIIDICWGPEGKSMLIFKEKCRNIHSLLWTKSYPADKKVPSSSSAGQPERAPYYWYHENLRFDKADEKEEDENIFGCYSPVTTKEMFAACSPSSDIQLYRKNDDAQGGKGHWYPAGKICTREVVTAMSFNISEGQLLHEKGAISVYSVQAKNEIGDVISELLHTVDDPFDDARILKYLVWTKPNCLWASGETTQSLCMITRTQVREADDDIWDFSLKDLGKKSGITPFDKVCGLRGNPKRKGIISWFGTTDAIHFATNGYDFNRQERDFFSEVFHTYDPTKPGGVDEAKDKILALVTDVLGQHEANRRRLAALEELIRSYLKKIYSGEVGFDPQKILEELYQCFSQ